ncbi:carboxymuconolactone decarboxylase family protein [Streptomyces sp. VRA16 Mangrove soil]|uniref:carboxymuconolactone decarboxylase family protein n=1 Tax=Streptomyces sp. VRA16 Mangrove soil TaxID=2817434 RepID=UPI001A9D221B|nr:carboxymuconolactone decarboxylase family protein [Streptomyces sp. VRA16 Mangrove soil]MBO1330524.1 carboxymuconolactone decarboxylase family protein [Streptomyces sp. VRA16 Mangrove soil]
MSARIPPLDAPFPADVAPVLGRMMPPGEEPIALFRTFAHHARLTEALHAWGAYQLSRELSLGLREREIVIDRTCARCGCAYEWGVHVARFAVRAGLTDDQITSLARGTGADACWTDERDRLLIEAVDALHTRHDVDDPLWARLAAAFSAEQLLDLLMLCGFYHAISFVARAARLAPEPGSTPL